MNHLDLFSGIGGFSLGLEATGGFKTVAFCEIEEFPRKVLQKHWPNVKQYEDIRKLNYDRLKADGIGLIDIITGGYPCQPFSVAGRKKGEKDPRHLWPEMFRIIKECRPTWVIGENVSGHIKQGLDTVLKNLESEMYSTRTFSVSASSIGANHKRERVWIVAHSERNDNQQALERVDGEEKEIPREHRAKDSDARKPGGAGAVRKASSEYVANAAAHGSLDEPERDAGSMGKESKREEEARNQSSVRAAPRSADVEDAGRALRSRAIIEGAAENEDGEEDAYIHQRPGWWESEPNVGRVAHGIPNRVHRLKALGNSLVPMIPYIIGKSILETYNG